MHSQLSEAALLARQAAEALNAQFAWLIDHRDGDGVADLFSADGVYDMSDHVYSGRGEIAQFYAIRKARGRRTARHVFTNLRLEFEQPSLARAVSILTLYAYDGAPPYPAHPIMISDYQDVLMREADGIWRYRSRTIVPVFGALPMLRKPA